MTTREMLHVVVDRASREGVGNRRGILTALDQPAGTLEILLANAPADDEPFDPADLEGTDEGPLIPHAEIVHSFSK